MGAKDDSDPAAAISRTIGRRVRASRTGARWTLDELARRSGVSRRMLVNIEQGATNPSIATLLRLSDALGIGLPALVDNGSADDGGVVVNRAGEVAAMWTSDAGGRATMVAGTGAPDVSELWDWMLGPGDLYRSEPHRVGTWELLLVITGTITLAVDDVELTLSPGDSASFDGSLAHSYANADADDPARFSLAVFEPGLSTDAT